MKRQNLCALAALLALGAGFLLHSASDGSGAGKLLMVLGLLLLVAAIIASSAGMRKHPLLCPVCKRPVRFRGRWFPGTGYVGTAVCPHCGTVLRPEDLKRET